MSADAIHQIAQLQEQLAQLYSELPSVPRSPKDKIREGIDSGEGLTPRKDVGTHLNKCDATIYNYVARGVLPKPIKIGGSVYFKNSELKAMGL